METTKQKILKNMDKEIKINYLLSIGLFNQNSLLEMEERGL